MSDNKYRGPFSGGRGLAAWILIAITGAVAAYLLTPRPGDRAANAAREFSLMHEEVRRAGLRARGLPEFIPETTTEWQEFCQGWPDHQSCETLREVGYPFSWERMEGQCSAEKKVREEGTEHYYSEDSGYRRIWRKYDENLDPETACAAYGIDLMGEES